MFKKDEITNNKNTKKFIIFMLIFIISFSTLIPVLASPIEDSIIGIFTGEEIWASEDFEYDDTTLTGFSESGRAKFEHNKDLIIPQNNKEGEPIAAIADNAFWNGAQVEDKDRIKSLELPDTIEVIGKKAFGGNLIKNLEIPASVKSIDDSAFISNQIEDIIINEGLEFIGSLSFSHNKLTEVTIPSSMKGLGQRAFYDNEISKLTILPGIEKLGAQCFENNIIQELEIPKTVKYIDLGAFVYNSLETVKLPENLEILGPKSFGVNNIESVTFPETVEWFCPNSFRKNKGFESGEFKIFIDKIIEIDGDIKESALKDKLSEEIKVRAAVFEGLIDETKHEIDIKLWERVEEEDEYLIYRGKFEEISAEIIKIIEEAEGCGSGSENIVENMERTSLIVKVKLTGELLEPEEPTEPTEPEEPEEPGEPGEIWDPKYFTFEETTLTGFSELGEEKFLEDKDLVIPAETSDGQAIDAIGDRAFNSEDMYQEYDEIRSLELPGTIKSVGMMAFRNQDIVHLKLPDSIKELGDGAFAANRDLKTLKLSDSLTKIPNAAFSFSKIKELVIPEGVTEIGGSAFSDNSLLSDLTIPGTVEKIASRAFMNVVVVDLTIPGSVKKIESSAFSGGTLSSLTLEEGIETIGSDAFSRNKLSKIIIPKSVTKLEKSAFNWIPNINIKYALLIEALEEAEGIETEGKTQESADALQAAIEAGKVVNNKPTATLDEVKEAVEAISDAIEGLVAPDFEFSDGMITKYNGTATELVIPGKINGEEVTAIGASALKGKNLTSVKIPDTVENIGMFAFAQNKLTAIELPGALTEMGNMAFYDNELTSVKIPDGLSVISTAAFFNNKLTSVEMPESVTSIAKQAFMNNNLEEVIIPSQVKDIGTSAFENNGLGEVIIPSSVNIIGDKAFDRNENIKLTYSILVEIISEAEGIETEGKPEENIDALQSAIEAGKIINDKSTATLEEVKEAVEAITDAVEGLVAFDFEFSDGVITKYNGTATKLIIPKKINGEEVTAIGASALKGKNLTSVKIPDTVENIGMAAFAQNKLAAIELPGALTEMGNMAFYGNELTSVKIPDGLTVIPTAAFSDNELTSVEIPESVTSIAMKAFMNNNLEEVIIPSQVKDIGTSAFENNSLGEVIIPSSVNIIGDKAFDRNENIKLTYSILVEIISEAEGIETGGKTQESADALQAAIEAGKVVNNKPTATLDEVKEAVEAISDAIEGLVAPDFEFSDGMITKYNGTATELVIPGEINGEEVTAIGASALKGKNLTSVKIPDTVENIGMFAFAQNKLTAIELPGALTEMGNMAFYDNELTSVKIPDGLSVISTAAFFNNKLTSVEMPESVTSIAKQAFMNNNLEEVIIPSQVKDIGTSAFENNGLREVIIPSSVNVIGNKAFDGNENIKLTYSILVEIISEAEGIETGGKTQESVEALQTAIEAGKVVNNKPAATLAEVKEAVEAITDAIEGLIPYEYIVTPQEDTDVYDIGQTTDGIKTMKVKSGIEGLKYFKVNIQSSGDVHEGKETAVFVHLRDGKQLSINITFADFDADTVDEAGAGFNVEAGDIIKVYIVDKLTNDPSINPILLQK